MKYTKLKETTFEDLQLNAGIICTRFDPKTGTITDDDILGATGGGITVSIVPTFSDLADGIDNATKNLKELKRIESIEVKMSGTIMTIDTATAKILLGAADIDSTDSTKVTGRLDLKTTDFIDLWWVGDKSNADGFMAIKISNALSTAGFKFKSNDKDKGSFDFEFTGHGTITDQDTLPFEIYVS